jgi:hypothetical protein
MSKRLKMIIIIIGGIILLLILLGFVGNLIYVNMMHSMVSDVEKTQKTDENMKMIQISSGEDSLVGYVRSINFNEKRKTIIYLPGSGEIAYNAVIKHGNQFPDYVFACVDYHGAQNSTGVMNESSILETGKQLYSFLLQQDYVDTNNIYIMGYSYSTGIATYVASQRDCKGLVLVAPYRNSADMDNKYTPIYYGPMCLFISENFKTSQYAKTVKAKTLLITSSADSTMNSKFAYSLQNDFPNAEVKEYNGVPHDGYFDNNDIISKISIFFN